MTNDEAVRILSLHLMQCGGMMPIEWVRANGEGSELMQAFRLALDALRDKWISVEDELPATNDTVLCFPRHGKQFIARYDHKWERWRVPGSRVVAHWQPLPQPPSGKAQEVGDD